MLNDFCCRQARGLGVKKVLLRNTTKEPLTIRPLANIGLYVNVGGVSDLEDVLVRSLLQCRLDVEKAGGVKKKQKPWLVTQLVGASFDVPAEGSVVLHVVRLPTEVLSEDTQECLTKGTKVAYEGALLFESTRPNSAQTKFILHRIFVDGWWCMSRSQALESAIDLGKLGHVNQWNPVDFSCRLHNLSDIPLSLTAELLPLSAPSTPHEVALKCDIETILVERDTESGIPAARMS